MICPNLPAGFDFTDPDIYAERLPVEELAELRRTVPIWWNDQPVGKGGFNDGGFWVVTKHKDVKEVSLRSDVFSTFQNTALPRFPDDIPRQNIDMRRAVLSTSMPRTTPGCARSSRADSPRGLSDGCVTNWRARPGHRESRCGTGCGDFVEQVSCELPLQAIAGLLGVPQEDRIKLFRWSNEMTGSEDPEYARR